MNIQMNKQSLGLIFIGLISNQAMAINVIEPDELQTSSFMISDPDSHVKTLGQVTFQIDLAAAHDDLLALKVRRSSLKLKDNRPFSAFGVHKDAGVIVIAGGEVSHISIASAEDKQGIIDSQILFYGKDNQVISPAPDDIAVFNADLKPLEFTYKPLQVPGSLQIPVSIALDASGSMKGHMGKVVKATNEFMSKLPDFTICRLLTFSDDVKHLTTMDKVGLTSCPSSAYLLSTSLKAYGMTALYKAINTGFGSDIKQDFPNIVIVVTDGKNTVNSTESLSSLKTSKAESNSKLFVFWAGSYEKGYLQGLADLEFVSTQNLETELESFFNSLGVSLSGLQSLHIRK